MIYIYIYVYIYIYIDVYMMYMLILSAFVEKHLLVGCRPIESIDALRSMEFEDPKM